MAAIAAVLLGAGLPACTATSTSSARTSASPTPAGMGTEVIRASTTNADAATVTVRASGVFTDTGTLKLPIGNPRTMTFHFTRGNLTVLNATGPASGPRHLNKATCAFSQSTAGTYRILSGPSTGFYGGATGYGTYAFNSGGITPKTSGGSCDTDGKATPADAIFTFLFQGPLVLNLRS